MEGSTPEGFPPVTAASAPEPCRICGGELAPCFNGHLLDHVEVTYHRCAGCQSLLLPSPHWLDEAYGKVIVPDPDQGSLARTLFLHRCIRRLRARGVRLLPRRGRSLDVGCGKGLLLRLLLDDGWEAEGYDPYPQAVFAQDHLLSEMPAEPTFDLVSLVEVLEHTLDPVETLLRLKRCLAPKGFLLVSTELYDPTRHGPDWVYLAPEHGQHITLFSRQGLRSAATRAGLDWLGSLDWGGQPFLHLLAPVGTRPSTFTLWLLNWRHGRGEHRHGKDRKV